jgi:Ca2+-binding EF-hand superfamily protein
MVCIRLVQVGLLALAFAPLALAGDAPKDAPKKGETQRRPSDVIFLLVEMSDFDTEATAELQQMYDLLRKLDKNGDGKIDAGELKHLRTEIIDNRVDRIFKKLDADGDGKISKEEAKGRIKENFDRLDRNSDGFVTRDELRQGIEERPRTPAPAAKE